MFYMFYMCSESLFGCSADEIQLMYDQGYPGRIGFVVATSETSSYGEESLNSGRWSNDPMSLNVYRADRDRMQARHNYTGVAVFRLDNNDNMYINPRKACADWYQVGRVHLASVVLFRSSVTY